VKTAIDLALYLKTHAQHIEARLDELIPETQEPYKRLFQAARYSLFSGGKRIRPIFALAACQDLEGPLEHALTPVCTLEMIHTYSMIHDDLPCMDNDDFRRGKPTLHKAFPEGHALLAADYLLTYAFEILTEAPDLTSDQKIQLIALLAKQAGGHGMIAGQVLDIEAETQPVDSEGLERIHRCKTGALLSAAVEFGGILAKAPESTLETLRCFGSEIGLAFQIVDDILDVTASEQKHGRKLSSDIQNSKKTYVTLLGLEGSKKAAQDQLEKALDQLDQLPHHALLLSELSRYIIERKL